MAEAERRSVTVHIFLPKFYDSDTILSRPFPLTIASNDTVEHALQLVQTALEERKITTDNTSKLQLVVRGTQDALTKPALLDNIGSDSASVEFDLIPINSQDTLVDLLRVASMGTPDIPVLASPAAETSSDEVWEVNMSSEHPTPNHSEVIVSDDAEPVMHRARSSGLNVASSASSSSLESITSPSPSVPLPDASHSDATKHPVPVSSLSSLPPPPPPRTTPPPASTAPANNDHSPDRRKYQGVPKVLLPGATTTAPATGSSKPSGKAGKGKQVTTSDVAVTFTVVGLEMSQQAQEARANWQEMEKHKGIRALLGRTDNLIESPEIKNVSKMLHDAHDSFQHLIKSSKSVFEYDKALFNSGRVFMEENVKPALKLENRYVKCRAEFEARMAIWEKLEKAKENPKPGANPIKPEKLDAARTKLVEADFELSNAKKEFMRAMVIINSTKEPVYNGVIASLAIMLKGIQPTWDPVNGKSSDREEAGKSN